MLLHFFVRIAIIIAIVVKIAIDIAIVQKFSDLAYVPFRVGPVSGDS